MSDPDASAIIDTFRRRCELRGLDIVHPFRADIYNGRGGDRHALEMFGRERSLGILVGNTRAFWPVFGRALAHDGRLLGETDPMDVCVMAAVLDAVAATSVRASIRWAHTPPPNAFPIQRLAHDVGLAYLAPSRLSVHPEFGPWFGLRSVVTFEADAPAELHSAPIESTCDACEQQCFPAFECALAKLAAPEAYARNIAENWRDWLAIRDACPVGRGYRYRDDQCRYHYTKEREILVSLANEWRL